jgi:hypothetical protein
MLPNELHQLLKKHIESKVNSPLEDFAIEGHSSPDATGDVSVTGSYRIGSEERRFFFTVTVNLISRKMQNLQQY